MSRYCTLDPQHDLVPGLSLSAADLTAADDYVDTLLLSRDIDPYAVRLPNRLLSRIALHYALYEATIRAMATGQDSAFKEKSDGYRQILQDEIALLTPAALGQAVPTVTVTPVLFSMDIGRA